MLTAYIVSLILLFFKQNVYFPPMSLNSLLMLLTVQGTQQDCGGDLTRTQLKPPPLSRDAPGPVSGCRGFNKVPIWSLSKVKDINMATDRTSFQLCFLAKASRLYVSTHFYSV